MKIVLLIPDGVGIKNYLYTSFIDLLKSDGHEIIVWHNVPKGAIEEAEKIHSQGITWTDLPAYSEGNVERILRDSTAYARLRWNTKVSDNPTIMEFWKKHKPSLNVRLLQLLASFIGFFIGLNYKFILASEKHRNKLILKNKKTKNFIKYLKEQKPDVVFCTHQRSINAAPAMLVAKDLGIRTVTAIFSWDNIPKGRMAVSADKYAVWSDYMRDELAKFYPEIKAEKVFITGTPQFEFYKNERLYNTREAFAKAFDLNSEKKWLCYSGDDELTSPFDPKYLEDLLLAVNQLPEEKRPIVLLRRAPVDTSGRFEYLKSRFQNLHTIDPAWKSDVSRNNFSASYPSYDDVGLLVNLVRHCDAVFNVGSTMAHDFAQFNKPAFYVNYDAVPGSRWTTSFIYKFQHFRSMGSLNPVGWINKPEDFLTAVKRLIDNEEIENDRLAWFETIHSVNIETASKNIIELLKDA